MRGGKVVGTLGCLSAQGWPEPICESGNAGCLPRTLRRLFGIGDEATIHYPPY